MSDERPQNRSPRWTGHLLTLSWTIGVVAFGLVTAPLSAKDWPQWRGVERLGVWTETDIVREFPDDGLTVKNPHQWRLLGASGRGQPSLCARLYRDRAADHGWD